MGSNCALVAEVVQLKKTARYNIGQWDFARDAPKEATREARTYA
jgi:hypothetical protein